ncbi:hypothetical protein V8B97DRAFT_1922493 [Scleroderma yunnanense]
MATLNGSPIPVDELPMYYDYASAAQLSNQVYVAVSIVLLYEYFLTLDQEIDFIWVPSLLMAIGELLLNRRYRGSVGHHPMYYIYICADFPGTIHALVTV